MKSKTVQVHGLNNTGPRCATCGIGSMTNHRLKKNKNGAWVHTNGCPVKWSQWVMPDGSFGKGNN